MDGGLTVSSAVTMEVRMVKVLLHRLLKVPLPDLRLTYVSSRVSEGCCCHGDPRLPWCRCCDSAHMLMLSWCVCRFQVQSSSWTET